MKQEICVIGGGPVGCALAVALKRKGYSVCVFERHPDIRLTAPPAGRSINLVLTKRGIRLAKDLGLESELLAQTVEVTGRAIHDIHGDVVYQPYGRSGECNYSVDRLLLNRFWLTAAEKEGCRIVFDHTLAEMDVDMGFLVFSSTAGAQYAPIPLSSFSMIFGADGGGSIVRKSLKAAGLVSVSELPLSTGYKEFVFPASSSGTYSMDPHSLHIWPRGEHMLMALANTDGKTFTGTMFMTHDIFREATVSVDTASTFLSHHYKDAVEKTLQSETVSNFIHFREGMLCTVKATPWLVSSGTIPICLIGDAAHAIVPFFGQGVNCGFEDVYVLMGLVESCGGDLNSAVATFSQTRKTDTDAIADMAVENLEEMRSKVGDARFRFLKKLDAWIVDKFGDIYASRYALVMYSYNGYSKCEEYGEIQWGFLERVVKNFQLTPESDLEKDVDLHLLETDIRTCIVPELVRLGIVMS